MKKRTYLLLFLIVSVFIMCGFKGGNGFDIEINNSYAVATKSSEVDTVAERLNMEESIVKSYFTKNALKLIAVSSDGKTQVRISRFTDNFSSDVYDAENLNDKQTSQMISLYSSSYDTATVIESDGRKFAKTVGLLKDSGGEYTVTQYVTIAGGGVYVITCYNPGRGTSEEIENIFSTFTVRDMSTRIAAYQTRRKWIIPLIVVLCVAVVLSVFGLSKKLFEK